MTEKKGLSSENERQNKNKHKRGQSKNAVMWAQWCEHRNGRAAMAATRMWQWDYGDEIAVKRAWRWASSNESMVMRKWQRMQYWEGSGTSMTMRAW